MGLRYIWDKYSTKTEVTENSESINVFASGIAYQTYFHLISSYTIDGSSYRVVSTTTLCDLSDGAVNEFNIPAGYAFRMGYHFDYIFNYIMIAPYAMTITVQGTSSRPRIVSDLYFLLNTLLDEQVKDSLLGITSHSSNSAYPSDGVSGSYWYIYKGSDSIDPTAISYPDEVESDQEIVVSLTKPVSTYGGTISYLYEYSADGSGVWQTIKNTTEDSIVFLVPESVTSTLQIRVTASDDMGYTSTTPVVGPVSNISIEKDHNIRLHKKMSDNSYKTVYLETSSLVVKVGNDTLEDILTQIESDIAALKG